MPKGMDTKAEKNLLSIEGTIVVMEHLGKDMNGICAEANDIIVELLEELRIRYAKENNIELSCLRFVDEIRK